MQSLDDLRTAQARDGRIWPSYGHLGVANVPETAAAILGLAVDRPLPIPALEWTGLIDHVVLVVIDGLGWNRARMLRSSVPALDRLATNATVTPLTSTYPSETSAAMITLYTGLQPIEHGLIGWFTRFDEPTVIGQSLPFRSLDGASMDRAYGHDPSELFDASSRLPITRRLAAEGISVAYLNPTNIADSAASQLSAGSADRIGYHGIDEAFDTLRHRLETAETPTYHLIYDPKVDAMGHHHGTASEPFHAAVRRVTASLFDRFIDRLDPQTAERTAVLVTADHGQLDTDPAANVDLGALDDSGEIRVRARLQRDMTGGPIYLAGGPRNIQFHLQDGEIAPLRAELERELSVLTLDRDEYLAAELFGDRPPSATFEQRAPDLIAIPDELSVWYDDGNLDEIGMHGGLHPDEMVVPLAFARADEL